MMRLCADVHDYYAPLYARLLCAFICNEARACPVRNRALLDTTSTQCTSTRQSALAQALEETNTSTRTHTRRASTTSMINNAGHTHAPEVGSTPHHTRTAHMSCKHTPSPSMASLLPGSSLMPLPTSRPSDGSYARKFVSGIHTDTQPEPETDIDGDAQILVHGRSKNHSQMQKLLSRAPRVHLLSLTHVTHVTHAPCRPLVLNSSRKSSDGDLKKFKSTHKPER